MKKTLICVLTLIISSYFIPSRSSAKLSDCSKIEDTLRCFMSLPKHNTWITEPKYRIENGLKIVSYSFSSQIWPIDSQNIWTHRIDLYIPDKIKHHTAFLYINGGGNKNEDGTQATNVPQEGLDFVKIAKDQNIIVANLLDVPNQWMIFDDHIARKEDQLVAYTYRKILENVSKNKYLAAHLPMAKAAIIAMDEVQNFSLKKNNFKIDNFIISGASKRGWAAWLTAIADTRVSAIVPIVIDILNIKPNIKNICSVYNGKCPPALKDYEKENIFNFLDTKNGADLLKIEDPYSYLSNNKYKKRFEIPKFIINMASDDFFTPDSSRFYFKNLPGEKHIRYIPNSPHYFKGNLVSNRSHSFDKINLSVENFIHFQLNKKSFPDLKWNFAKDRIDITTNIKPEKIILWSSFNRESRDFRCLNSYSKFSFYLKWVKSFTTDNLCDQSYTSSEINFDCQDRNCKVAVDLGHSNQGWYADFVEVIYNSKGNIFSLTSEVSISQIGN